MYEKMRAIGALSSLRCVARMANIPSPIVSNSFQIEQLAIENASQLNCSFSLRRRFCSALLSGIIHGNHSQMQLNNQNVMNLEMPSMLWTTVAFSSEASMVENDSSDAGTAKEVYEKMLKCVSEMRTAPPNAWLWSLVAKCDTHEDIKLLFDILERLRRFRLSNLRIPDNFNIALCRDVTKACVRVGAIDFGKMALWKHNLYGLTPDIGSAHFLLLHAKQHNDVNHMVEVMKLVKKNGLPLRPGTADIVFSICYSADRWGLMSKYGKRFVKSGVSLRRTSFDLWMEFAVRKGDTKALWEIEKWRSESMKQHSLSTGFSCAKGLLLDHKPESAAAIIQAINQSTTDTKRAGFVVELQKLVSEWPLEVIKHQKEENRKVFAAALQNDISTLISALPSVGVATNLTMEDLTIKGVIS
ncbi:uncharacterized protein [Primulina huaijiensis]|uniref:uncharacterized protein isoform X1 n=1 Tax=Primulina huaijiensis TaxID=1492673 RepID=UPI003CC747A0